MISENIIVKSSDWHTVDNLRFTYELNLPVSLVKSVTGHFKISISEVHNYDVSIDYDVRYGRKGFIDFIRSGQLSFDKIFNSGIKKFILSFTRDSVNDQIINTTKIDFEIDNSGISLMSNISEDNRIDKFEYLSVFGTYLGSFRSDISIISPEFDIELTEFPNVNYVYIQEFNRFYFIDDIIIVRTSLYHFICHCDVLMSFMSGILNLDVFVNRQEFDFNNGIPDLKLPIQNNKEIIYEYPKISARLDLGNHYSEITHRYTISVCTSKSLRELNYDKYGTVVSPYNLTSHTLVCTNKNVSHVIHQILGDTNIVESIKNLWNDSSNCFISAKVFPWDITTRNNNSDPSISGMFNCDLMTAKTWIIGTKELIFDDWVEGICWYGRNNAAAFSEVYCGVCTFNRKYNDWRDFAPYTVINFYIPLVGWVTLDNDIIYDPYYGYKFYCRYLIDVVTGDCLFQMYKYVVNGIVTEWVKGEVAPDSKYIKIIYQYDFNPTNDILIANNNQTEMTRKTLKTAVSLFAAIATNGLLAGSAVSAATAETAKQKGVQRSAKQLKIDKAKVASAKNRETAGYIDAVSDFTIGMMSNTANSDNRGVANSNFNGFSTGTEFIIQYVRYDIIEPNGYAHLLGRPSSYKGKLGALNGYTEVGGCHIENIKNATTDELDEINDKLRSGVLLSDKI